MRLVSTQTFEDGGIPFLSSTVDEIIDIWQRPTRQLSSNQCSCPAHAFSPIWLACLPSEPPLVLGN